MYVLTTCVRVCVDVCVCVCVCFRVCVYVCGCVTSTLLRKNYNNGGSLEELRDIEVRPPPLSGRSLFIYLFHIVEALSTRDRIGSRVPALLLTLTHIYHPEHIPALLKGTSTLYTAVF